MLMSFGDPLLREEIGLGAGRDGLGRQRGSASAHEEMGLDAKGGPPALWRRWEWALGGFTLELEVHAWTLGAVRLGAGGDVIGYLGKARRGVWDDAAGGCASG